MPTYQYRCAKCGEQFEAWQSIHDDSLTVHDGECGGALNKVLAVGGIVLKGPGFYRTDSRSSARGKDGRGKDGKAAESASGNGSGEKKSGESDSKKDTKKSETSASSSSKSDTAKT